MLAQLNFAQTFAAGTDLQVLLPKQKTLTKDLPHAELLASVR